MSQVPVTVSVPYYRCQHTIRRAVETLLGQTHTDLRIVVVNDGMKPTRTKPVWEPLDGISDQRLTRFDLAHNRGRFYADAVVLASCMTPWFAICDADDWAEPEWLAELAGVMRDSGPSVGAVVSPHLVHRGPKSPGKVEPVDGDVFSDRRIPRLKHLAHHAALYDTKKLRDVGGPNPGYTIGYDTLLINAMRLRYRVRASMIPRYHRVRRAGSLTQAAGTRFGSPARNQVINALSQLYGRAVSATDPVSVIVDAIRPEIMRDVVADASRLRQELQGVNR